MLYSAYVSFLDMPNACEPEMFRDIVVVDVPEDAVCIDDFIAEYVSSLGLAPSFSVIAIAEGEITSPDDFFDDDEDDDDDEEDVYMPEEPDPNKQESAWEDYLEESFPSEMS